MRLQRQLGFQPMSNNAYRGMFCRYWRWRTACLSSRYKLPPSVILQMDTGHKASAAIRRSKPFRTICVRLLDGRRNAVRMRCGDFRSRAQQYADHGTEGSTSWLMSMWRSVNILPTMRDRQVANADWWQTQNLTF